MSTKTLRKRIALVAVAALAVTGLSTVPANAAGSGQITPTGGVVKSAESATATMSAVVGNQAIFTFNNSADTNYYVTSDANGKIVATDPEAGTTADPIDGVNFSSGVLINPDDNDEVVEIAVTATAPGTNVVKVQTLTAGTGLYTLVAKVTITWVASKATVGVDAAQSLVYAIADGGTCNFGDNHAGDVNAASTDTDARTSVPAGTKLDVCYIARNKDGDVVTADAATTVISSAGQTFNGENASGDGYLDTANDAPASTFVGKSTITVILIDDLGYSATLTTTVTYYGDVASITIGNAPYAGWYAASYGGGESADTDTGVDVATDADYAPGVAASGMGFLALTAKDSGGNVVNYLNATGDHAGITVDSDYTAGAPAAGTSDSAGATVVLSDGATDIAPAALGTNVLIVNCSASEKAEKLTITVLGINDDGDYVVSNAATFYCSDAASTVSVTASAGAVNVNVKDANGYPVADGTEVVLAASNGSVVAPSTKTTMIGAFKTGATFIASSTAASSTVTAIVGSKSGTSAAIAGTGTSIESQITSLVAAIAKLQKAIAKINKRLKK